MRRKYVYVIKLQRVVKISDKIKLIDFNAHKYSLYAHINSIIFTHHI